VSAEQLAFDGPGRVFAPAAVMTAHHGRNDAMIASVARLYIPDGATVIDATWGKGGFWHRTDTSRFRLVGADLLEVPGAALRADFQRLPFKASSADVITLDPPYVHATTQGRMIHSTYRNNETVRGATYGHVTELYRAGMIEASRVLRPGGTCWVKCQDAVEGRQQKWAVVSMHAMALELGFAAQDLFLLVVPNPPGGLHAERQQHARRNHSYLWIFAKRGRS
jgi:hypothetical protein